MPTSDKLANSFRKTKNEEIVPNSFYKVRRVLKIKSNQKITPKRESYRPISFMNTDRKILTRMIT